MKPLPLMSIRLIYTDKWCGTPIKWAFLGENWPKSKGLYLFSRGKQNLLFIQKWPTFKDDEENTSH